MTLVVVNLLGMKLSSAGIVSFLMLIGYSVDTDIMLTTRLLKSGEGSLNQRLIEHSKPD
jgi:preprotein translocase subunit SecF